MSIFKANLEREWRVRRKLLVEYLAASIAIAILLPWGTAKGFAIVGVFLAASLGARIGGDDTVSGMSEFLLTRPVARTRWLVIRFVTGLLPIAMLLLLFAASDGLGLHRALGNVLAAPLGIEAAVDRDFPWLHYFLGALVVSLVYTMTFGLAVKETRPDRVLDLRIAGFLGGLLSVGALAMGSLFLSHWWLDRAPPTLENTQLHPVHLIFTGLMVALIAGCYLDARRELNRREVTGDAAALVLAERRSGIGLVIGLLILLVVAAIVFSYISLADAPVSPQNAPVLEGR